MSDASREIATRILSRDGQELARTRLRLTVLRGPNESATQEFAQDTVRVGKGADNDFVLEDTTVSSKHAELQLTDQGLVVRDLGSTNGTWVNGVRIKEAFLAPGAQLSLGETVLSVEDAGEVRVKLSRTLSFGRLLGYGTAMREVFAVLEKAAPSEKTVLIEGETGTGKDVCANAIHEASPRAEGPFIVFDCGAVAATLVESELFGHSRGAFTGATDTTAGAFERANGGTLFLDELGELPLDLQPKLLRVLEERAVRRIGDGKRIPVDVRVIAATNRNLQAEVAEGKFRRDLYFRLNVIKITLPPLRKRLEDLPLLCRAILDEEPGPERQLTPAALAMLSAYDWPGNVRELRNVLSRAVTFAEGSIEPSHLPAFEGSLTKGKGGDLEIETHLPYHSAKDRLIERFERAYVETILEQNGGNVSKAAEISMIPRQTLHRLMSRHGIKSKR